MTGQLLYMSSPCRPGRTCSHSLQQPTDERHAGGHLCIRQLAVRLRGVMALDPVGGATGVGGGGAMWAAVPARIDSSCH